MPDFAYSNPPPPRWGTRDSRHRTFGSGVLSGPCRAGASGGSQTRPPKSFQCYHQFPRQSTANPPPIHHQIYHQCTANPLKVHRWHDRMQTSWASLENPNRHSLTSSLTQPPIRRSCAVNPLYSLVSGFSKLTERNPLETTRRIHWGKREPLAAAHALTAREPLPDVISQLCNLHEATARHPRLCTRRPLWCCWPALVSAVIPSAHRLRCRLLFAVFQVCRTLPPHRPPPPLESAALLPHIRGIEGHTPGGRRAPLMTGPMGPKGGWRQRPPPPPPPPLGSHARRATPRHTPLPST